MLSLGTFSEQLAILTAFWWAWTPLVLFAIFVTLWLMYIRAFFLARTPQTLLEIFIPRELPKTPKAMEQVLAGLYALRNAPASFKSKYWDGEATLWFSLEMASFGGDIHFYVRTPAKHRNIVEALFYAHYQNVEVAQVPDYVERVPRTLAGLRKMGYELYGTELTLAKPDAYPIRTYQDFSTAEEEEKLDPISALLEVLRKVKKDDVILIQVLARPAPPEWQKEGEALVKKLREEKSKKVGSAAEEGGVSFTMLTPGETEILKAIGRNIAKPGFEAVIRYLYYGPRADWDLDFARGGVFSCFNQYAALSLNYFKINGKAQTLLHWSQPPFLFARARREARQRRILARYRKRAITRTTLSDKAKSGLLFRLNVRTPPMILNTEEIATIWHLPSHLVMTGPLVKRVESRRVGPPVDLPIFAENERDLPWDQGRGEAPTGSTPAPTSR